MSAKLESVEMEKDSANGRKEKPNCLESGNKINIEIRSSSFSKYRYAKRNDGKDNS